LFDTGGNVFEWCSDWHGAYNPDEEINPQGPKGGESRVLKGGAWYFNYTRCRIAGRWSSTPETVHINYGFRLVLSVKEK
jgi:formylglycine-generating enzyme required for sulfatase activity